jgi:hypothetical protein
VRRWISLIVNSSSPGLEAAFAGGEVLPGLLVERFAEPLAGFLAEAPTVGFFLFVDFLAIRRYLSERIQRGTLHRIDITQHP